MIVRTDTLERIDADGQRDKVWLEINNNYPYAVKINFSETEFKRAKRWCEERGIPFHVKTASGYSYRSRYIGHGQIRFKQASHQLLFQLTMTSFADDQN